MGKLSRDDIVCFFLFFFFAQTLITQNYFHLTLWLKSSRFFFLTLISALWRRVLWIILCWFPSVPVKLGSGPWEQRWGADVKSFRCEASWLVFSYPNHGVAARGPFYVICMLRKDLAIRIFTGFRKNSLNGLWSCTENRALPEPDVTVRAEERFRFSVTVTYLK